MKLKTITLLLLLTLLTVGETRKIKRRTKLTLGPFITTFVLGCAVMTAFEIGELYNIRKLRKKITKESLKQMQANLEHRRTIQETIDYCRESRFAYEQKANLVLSLEKSIIEIKVVTESKIGNPKKLRCRVKTEISEEDLGEKIKEFGERIQEMEEIYGEFKTEGKLSHFEPALKKASEKDQKNKEAAENKSMFCVIKKIEVFFKKFKESVLKMAQLDVDEMCDVDIIAGISEFNKRSAKRINKIKVLQEELKSSSNVIYRVLMNKSFESMSNSLEHVAAIESKNVANEIKSHSAKWENTKESRRRALMSLGSRLFSLMLISAVSSSKEAIDRKIGELSKKIPNLEKFATKVATFKKRFYFIHGSGKKYAEDSTVISSGSTIPALFGFVHFSEVSSKIAGLFNYKTIASLVKYSYSSIFKDEIYKSFLPDTWNRIYFRKLALNRDFTVSLQVLQIQKIVKNFEKKVGKYFKKGRKPFEIKQALRKRHFKGYDSFMEFQLRREMSGSKQRSYFKKDDLFFYDVGVAYDQKEVFALAKRGYEIISAHDMKKEKRESMPFAFSDHFNDQPANNQSTFTPFYVMATKQYSQGEKANVYCKVFHNGDIKFNFSELKGNFKAIAEKKMKIKIEKALRAIYIRKCNNMDSVADFTEFISSTEIKIKVLYNHFLGCVVLDRDLYKEKYNKYAQCFNKYHSGKVRTTRFDKSVYAISKGAIHSAGIVNAAKQDLKRDILKMITDLYGKSNKPNRGNNALFDSEELNFSILKPLYEVENAEEACKKHKEEFSKLSVTIDLSKKKKIKQKTRTFKQKIKYLKNKTKISIGKRGFGWVKRSITKKQESSKYKEATFKVYNRGIKETITVNDYFLLAHNKALKWEKKNNFSLVEAKAKANVFISVFGNLMQCSKTQSNIWKLSNKASSKVNNAVSNSKGKFRAFRLSAQTNQMLDYTDADRDFFRVNSLLKFKIEKQSGFYQASAVNWHDKCNFASWSTAIKFKRRGHFEFKVSKGTYEIEISTVQSKNKSDKLESTVILTATVLKEKEEKDEKSVYNKFGVEQAAERRYIHSGYTKIPADEFGEPSDIRIALNDEASLYLSFWTKRSERDFEQLYKKTCDKNK